MTFRPLTYAAVSPARNEEANLRRLGACLADQTRPPTAWVIVDDGSTDETPTIAQELARETPWITTISSRHEQAPDGQLRLGRRSGRDVMAFTAGLSPLEKAPDVVVKLDCDVSFEQDFFERLLAEFEGEPSLGIASGTAYERENGSWEPRHVTGSRVRGATRAYRRACLDELLPLEERLGWDVVDEIQARLRGWSTRSVADLPFRHHRRVGERDGARLQWTMQGEVAHYCGYRLSYLVLRALHRCRQDPAALGLIQGFFVSSLRRKRRHPNAAVRALVREEQRLRYLPRRAREAIGWH